MDRGNHIVVGMFLVLATMSCNDRATSHSPPKQTEAHKPAAPAPAKEPRKSSPLPTEEQQAEATELEPPLEKKPADVSKEKLELVVLSNNFLGLHLYYALRTKGTTGNIVISPLSIYLALSMLEAGARGRTRTQLSAFLDRTDGDSYDEAKASLLWTAITGDNRVSIANGIWVQDGCSIKAPYKELIAHHYGAEPRSIDLEGDPAGAVKAMNSWVSSQTQGKIEHIIGIDDVDPQTQLMLVTALHLKAAWAAQFSRDLTSPGQFTNIDGSTVEVPMMSISRKLRYASRSGLQVLELPYEGNGMSMWILLPNEADSIRIAGKKLEAVEMALSRERLAEWQQASKPTSVMLEMPRFRVEYESSLKERLDAIGISDAFSPDKADFLDMFEPADDPYYLSDVIHKTYLDVNEEGTEATAGTVAMKVKGKSLKAVKLTIDRPFLFFIQENTTGTLIFIGKVVEL
jgi:serpin B